MELYLTGVDVGKEILADRHQQQQSRQDDRTNASKNQSAMVQRRC